MNCASRLTLAINYQARARRARAWQKVTRVTEKRSDPGKQNNMLYIHWHTHL